MTDMAETPTQETPVHISSPQGTDSEIDMQLLESTLDYIRPAIQMDGGDIVLQKVHTASFVGFIYTNSILTSLTLPSLSMFTIIKSSVCTGASDFAEQDADLVVSDPWLMFELAKLRGGVYGVLQRAYVIGVLVVKQRY